MLGKLLKHEMIALSRFLLPLHIILLIAGVIGHFTISIHIGNYPKYVTALTLFTYLVLFIAISLTTFILIAMRFYKNLFTDEGYLTLTLPATVGQHLASKSLAAIFWFMLDFAVIIIAAILLCASPEFIKMVPHLQKVFVEETGFRPNEFLLMMCGMYFLELIVAPSYIYISVTIGQLFSSHRVLGAVVSYFLLCGLFQFLSLILLAVNGYMPYLFNITQTKGMMYRDYMEFAIFSSITIGNIVGLVSYIGSYYIMKHKINLN